MSNCSDGFVAFVLDQLADVDGVRDRRMFGAHGLAVDDVNFAILADDSLYFVVSSDSRPKYVAAGSEPFSYMKKSGRVVMRRYHAVPVDVLEDRAQLTDWAHEAVAIARLTAKRR